MILKNFNSCRQLFETYKKDRDMKFFYYDLTNYAQSRQYFNKLMEYQINYKEWETIIKKINLKESGLSDLFADCKDEKGLTEKWFLEAIESKLNKDKNRIKEFQSILEKYAGQYKDNRSKIKRRDTIRQFKEEANGIQTQAEEYQNAETEEGKQQNKIAWFIHDVNGLLSQTEKAHDHAKEVLEGLDQKLSRVEYEELSSQVYDYEEEKNLHIGNRDMIDMERENLQVQAEQTENKLHILQCARQQDSVSEEKGELDLLREKIAVARQQGADLEPERKALGLTLKNIFEERIQDNRQQQENLSENIQKKGKEAQDEANRVEELEEKIRDCFGKKGKLESQIEAYSRVEEQYNSKYQEELRRNILGSYEAGTLQICQQIYEQDLEKTMRERTESQKKWEADKETIRGQERRLEDKKEALIHKKIKIQKQTGRYQTYEKELEDRKAVLKYLDMEERYLLDRERILDVSGRKLRELEELRRNLEKEEDTLEKEYTGLTSGKVLELPEELENELKNNSYPGRGIIIGRSADGTKAVTAYFIMGRSENSRNRVFVTDGEGIRTQAFDPSKLTDPSLIIYAPVRVLGNKTIVTNGDQTDTIYEGLDKQLTFEQSLRSREFEPDGPNYTPRISGVMHIENGNYSYAMSILKSDNGNPDSCLRYTYAYEKAVAGEGRFIHTYKCDGNPLPSFEGEPKLVDIPDDIEAFTELLWNSLNEDNKVSLFVRYIDIATGTYTTKIVNKNH